MEVKVRPKKLKMAAASMAAMELAVIRAGAAVGEVSRSLNGSYRAYDQVAGKLRNYQNSINNEARVLRKFRTTLNTISERYNTTEVLLKAQRPNKGIDFGKLLRFIHAPKIIRTPFPWHNWNHQWPHIVGPAIIGPGRKINRDGLIDPWRDKGFEILRDIMKRRNGPMYETIKVMPDGTVVGVFSGPTGSVDPRAGLDKDNLGVYAGIGVAGTIIGASGAVDIGNGLIHGEGSVEVGKGSADIGGEAGLMRDGKFDPHADIHAGVDVTGVEVKGKGNIGIASIEGEGKIGHAEAKGNVSASLFDKDGKLSPSVEAKAKASATALEGKVKSQIGSKNNNIHAEAEGKVGHAEAEAKVKISKDGVDVKAGAEAYAAKGSVKGGITILGVKIDATASGGVGGAGAVAGGKVTGSSASGKLGIGLGVGGDVEVTVDWSNNVIAQKYNSFKKSVGKIFK